MDTDFELLQEHLLTFLTSKNLLDQFIYNHHNFPLKGTDLSISPEGIFGSAFSFTQTKEGYTFWSQTYLEWKAYIKEKL